VTVVAYQAGTFSNYARTEALAENRRGFLFSKKRFSRRDAEPRSSLLVSGTGAIRIIGRALPGQKHSGRSFNFNDGNELRVSAALRESFLKGPPMPNRH
jgi:hypothetical protein